MKQFLLVVIAALMVTACGKDTFQSKPQLFLKSVSSTTVPVGSDLQIFLRLTDKEGDFKDTIWVKKIATCTKSNWIDSTKYSIPGNVPKNTNFDGEIKVSLDYYIDQLQPQCTRPDTAVFSFWMKDEKGNISDTARTPSIIILR